MKLKYYGHSFFEIESSFKILIDPFVTDNPFCDKKTFDFKPHIICVTHAHSDHLGNALEIARLTQAVVVSCPEVAKEARAKYCKTEAMNIGGTISTGNLKIHMVDARHSAETGIACGFVLEDEGKTIYHAGDTGFFGDMKIIGEFFDIDWALLPIGDRFTMGIKSAAKAVDYLKCKNVIPMHYNTFDGIKAEFDDFKKEAGNKSNVFKMKPGDEKEL